MKRTLPIILSVIAWFFSIVPMTAQNDSIRKKVAIVLSGGGAKGMAHIGVMKVIEKAGIPVDIITGTSMGSIVGGLYSCGWNATALDSIVRQQDWAFLLSDKSVYYSQDLINRKKQNTYLLTKSFTAGKRNLAEAGGLIQGKNLTQLFKRLTAGYHTPISFDSLPIPFSCVATNIVDNTEYDFHSGILAEAMRASMSIPAAFAPIRKGEMVLVDGGLRNNFPADIARQLGADYIIGSTVQGPPKTADDLVSGADVLGQIVDVNCKNKYDDNLSITDIPIRVNTSGYGPASFNLSAIDTLIRRGEEEAMKHWGELMQLKKQLGLPEDYRPTLLSPNQEALKPIDFSEDSIPRRPQHDRIQGSLGVRFDTEEMVALQLNGIYLYSWKPIDIEATLRLGRNIMVSTVATWTPKRFVQMSLGYLFRHHSLNLYEQGENNWSVTYNQHQASLRFLNISIKNLSMDIFARADFYHFPRVLISSQMENTGFKIGNEDFISYHATLHYNSEDAWLFPTRGARFQAEYAYFTDNFANYNGHIGFSELSASWQMSFALSRRLTFQPLLYGRMLFGEEIPQIRRNVIGGQWFGHYLEQQMPFVGVHHIEATDKQFIACQLKLQEQLSTNNFILLKLAGAQHADRTQDILSHSPMLGCQLAYYYRTLLGPVGATLGYSNKTKQVDFFINLGFEF
ncbi:MAG: patatin-like phospholipase family protein [Prevotella sp.]|nr:patatin-like phospholipase family protein [Prevotella sp.]